jgi:hypothetical protein
VGGERGALFADADSQVCRDPLLGKQRAQGESPWQARHGIEMMADGDIDRADPEIDRSFAAGCGPYSSAFDGGGDRGETAKPQVEIDREEPKRGADQPPPFRPGKRAKSAQVMQPNGPE